MSIGKLEDCYHCHEQLDEVQNSGPNLCIIAYISPNDEFLSNVPKDECLPAIVNTGSSLLRTY